MSIRDRLPPSLGTLALRAVQLRCPTCGETSIFDGWFSMRESCANCHRMFDRAPGYLLGSIYFNYGVTALLVVIIYFSLFFSEVMSGKQLLFLLTGFILLFPLWFFRYARASWLAFDEKFDPWIDDPKSEEQHQKDVCGKIG